MDFYNTLFRCSSLGHLMTECKEKSNLDKYNDAVQKWNKLKAECLMLPEFNKDGKTKNKIKINKEIARNEQEQIVKQLFKVKDEISLSETALTHLIDVYVSSKYGRQTDLNNKFIKKGNQVEEDSITLYSRVKKELYKKNEQHLSNEFIKGTPDLYEGRLVTDADLVIDIKSSWDIFTFFRVKSKPINKLYYWQLQGYMALTGAKKAILAYCLVDTPPAMIWDEKARLRYRMGVSEDDQDYVKACEQIDLNMRYEDIPLEQRVIEFHIDRNDADIAMLYDKVKVARIELNKIESELCN